MWKLVNVVEETDSTFNGKIQVLKSIEGTRILVGGISQSGWLVKKVWKDALKKTKKLKPDVKRVLILGLGGGSVTELVSQYWPESEITGLDVDEKMVEMGRKYLKLDTLPDVRVVIADANSWVDKCKEKYDLVLVDMYKGINIPPEFTTVSFMEKVKKLLRKDGVAAFNHLYSSIEKKDADEFGKRLRKVYSATTLVTPEANIIYICFT
ncbi:MAG: fused MFS/spermidine synthase [Candidatus Blackburnbacteria bacterium]|nr:fused MFS/spermidine synthase [Candidatus Blackburnbacteria bacterium]